MGCSASKTAVEEIEIENGTLKTKKSSKKTRRISLDDELEHTKTTSAKSRDSGIQEMDYTNYSDPNMVRSNELLAPNTKTSYNRMKSKTILEELQAEGLIQGGKVHSGGAAFEVNLESNPKLQPLAPIKRPPARLERLKSGKRLITQQELDEKMKAAEERRNKIEKSKSKIASQLAAHVARSKEVDEGSINTRSLPPLPQSNLPTRTQASSNLSSNRISTNFDDELSSLEDGMSITNGTEDKDSDDLYLR